MICYLFLFFDFFFAFFFVAFFFVTFFLAFFFFAIIFPFQFIEFFLCLPQHDNTKFTIKKFVN